MNLQDFTNKLTELRDTKLWKSNYSNMRAVQGGITFSATLPPEFSQIKFGVYQYITARFFTPHSVSGYINLHALNLSHISVVDGVVVSKSPKKDLTNPNPNFPSSFHETIEDGDLKDLLRPVFDSYNSLSYIDLHTKLEAFARTNVEDNSGEELDYKADMRSTNEPGFRLRFRKKLGGPTALSQDFQKICDIFKIISVQFNPHGWNGISRVRCVRSGTTPLLDLSTFRVPSPGEITKEQISHYFSLGVRVASDFVSVYPHNCEFDFEERDRVLEIVKEELAMIPGVEITDISQRFIKYVSDEDDRELKWKLTQDAFNHPQLGKPIYETSSMAGDRAPDCWLVERAVIYLGRAWAIHYTINGVDPLEGNYVLVATEEQIREAFGKYRPDLIPEDWKPWAQLMYIANPQWCERNNSYDYNVGINLSSPIQRRNSLLTWTMGSLAARYHKSTGQNLPGITICNGYEKRVKLEKLQKLLSS